MRRSLHAITKNEDAISLGAVKTTDFSLYLQVFFSSYRALHSAVS